MLQSMLAAWRVSLRRTLADLPVVAAAALITLLAATLLAAGPIYSAAVSESGLHRLLAAAPYTDAGAAVEVRLAQEQAEPAIERVDDVLRNAFGQPNLEIRTRATSGSYALPTEPGEPVRDLAVFGYVDGIEDHATLLAGAWPASTAPGEPLQVAILEPIADTLGLAVGQRLDLPNRLDEERVLTVQVSGIYVPDETADPFWWGDASLVDGIDESVNYRTFGPWLAVRADFLARIKDSSIHLGWYAFPEPEAVQIADIGAMRVRLDELSLRVGDALEGRFPTIETGMPALLATSERSLLVSRAGVLLLLVQLGILAGYAIALTADLIVDHRRIDTALLRLRGASNRQVLVLALAEALLLAVPAALIGPWLAAASLLAFNVAGPLAGIGLAIDPRVTPDAYLAAAIAGVACAMLIVVPAVAASRSFSAERSAVRRPLTRTLGQRLGLDVALVALTAVGLWQLRLYGSPLTASVRGNLGLDPLLIAAPAIGILAGSVLALRIVPRLAQAADRLATTGRSLVGSLGARQLARRPLRYTRTALLIMLAVSMGVFSVSYGATWVGSQADQADYQVGGDVRITPFRRQAAIPDWAEATAFQSIPGVRAVLPLERETASFARSSGSGQLLAVDPEQVRTILDDNNGARGVGTVVEQLADSRVPSDGIALPPATHAVIVNVVAETTTTGDGFNRFTGDWETFDVDPLTTDGFGLAATAIIRDGHGVIQRLDGREVPFGPGAVELRVPFVPASAAARAVVESVGAGIAAPAELIGIDVAIRTPGGTFTSGRVVIDGLALSDTPDGIGTSVDLGDASAWRAAISTDERRDAAIVDWRATGAGDATVRPAILVQGFNAFRVHAWRASLSQQAIADVDAVANDALLAAIGAEVGDRVTALIDGNNRTLRIVGSVPAFPTTDAGRPLAIVDVVAIGAYRYVTTFGIHPPREWWLAAEPGVESAISVAKANGVLAGATVTTRSELQEALTTEPLAVAMIGALSIGFVVAILFAVIGLAVSTSVSARQRRSEFALLRALGMSTGQLSGWMWLESSSVVFVSVAGGIGLGLLIGWVVLPFVTVTAAGGTPYPPVVVDVPWASVALLTAISVGALVVTLILLARSIRRAGIGSVLRMGEE